MLEFKSFDLLLLRAMVERRRFNEIEKAIEIVEDAVDKEILKKLKEIAVGKEGSVEVVVELLKNKYSNELGIDRVVWERRIDEILSCRLSVGDIEAVLKEAGVRWKKIKFLEVIEECEKGIKGDENVVMRIDRILRRIGNGFREKEEGDYRSVFDAVLDRLWEEKEDETLLTGIRILDKVTNGLRRGTLSVVIAPTSMGKTSFMVYLSGIALLQGYSVLYVTLEDLREVIEKKILRFLLGDLSEESINEKLGMLKGIGSNVFVRYLSGVGVRDVFKVFEEYEEKRSKIDILVVDYGDLLVSDMKDEEFIELGKIFYQLLKFAVDRNIWVVSGSQAVRSAMRTKALALDHVSRSFRKVEVAHYVFGLLQTKEEQEKNQVRLSVLKNKFGVRGMTVSLEVDWRRCMFREVSE